jgi:hypothetical protein
MVAATLLLTSPAWAQKGKPKPPPPPGTVFYNAGGAIWGMNADGSGKRLAFEQGWGSPSSLVYGADLVLDRWWLMTEQTDQYDVVINPDGTPRNGPVAHFDVIAFRPDANAPNGIRAVRVTNLFGAVGGLQAAGWSNDGMDSFLTCSGYDYSGRVTINGSGESMLDLTGLDTTVRHIFRIRLTGPDIAGIEVAPETLATTEDVDPLATFPNFTPYSFSPGGDEIAYMTNDPRQIRVWDLATLSDRPVAGFLAYTQPLWSPAPGSRSIVLSNTSNVPRGIYLGDVDSSDPPALLLENTGATRYSGAVWSPDGTMLVYIRAAERIYPRPWEFWIDRIAVAGGNSTTLTNDLDKTLSKGVIGWVSNLPAP